MRVVVQRVIDASVEIEGKINGQIDKGYMLLVGFGLDDNIEIVKKMAYKVANLRIFPDSNDKLNLSIKDVDGKILSISQFTLYGDARKGNRPSFTSALKDGAKELYLEFNEILRKDYNLVVEEGIFGADMNVKITNVGPTTILLEI
ncbi:MAG: D-tyrosyl-tRNA(Tyr) deacylase [Acholeplasmatales bacterium]|nr:D-tyrosyl-tRNA(Tyr) deacylase [Acholeplasmatales bacterium]